MKNEHYYTAQPVSLRQPTIYNDTLRGLDVKFWTDHGVFSRGHTDTGSAELIAAMEVNDARRILDLGCGYGVIGIIAALLALEATVIMTDPNERAIELARQNITTNLLTNAEARPGEGYAPVTGECFDVIVTNPPIRAGNIVVFDLIAQAPRYLTATGRFYLVAQTKQGAKSFAKEMLRHFPEVNQVGQGSGFRVYCAYMTPL